MSLQTNERRIEAAERAVGRTEDVPCIILVSVGVDEDASAPNRAVYRAPIGYRTQDGKHDWIRRPGESRDALQNRATGEARSAYRVPMLIELYAHD